jgi:hypothetical protein
VSNVPPPSIGDPVDRDRSAATPTGGPPQPYIPPRSHPPGTRARLLVAGAVVAVLAIAGTAFVIAANDGDDTTAGLTSTMPLVATTAVAAPVTTATTALVTTTTSAGDPSTTSATTAATTTTPITTPITTPAVPDGALDLGFGVYVPVPDGWTTGAAGAMTQLTDGSTVVVAQTSVEPPGTDPALITQEYVNGFDATFETVGYSPTARVRTLDGVNPVDTYATYFVTFDASTGSIQSGYVDVSVRSDGLVLVYSVYGPDGQPRSFPSDAGEAMNAAFANAAPVGPTAALVQAPPFRVATAHEDVLVDGLVAFAAAPGFSVITEGDGTGFVTNNTIEDVEVDRITAQADTTAVTASAQAALAVNYSDLVFSEPVVDDADVYGVFHGRFTWTGTFVSGQPSTGIVDFYFDPGSTNALVASRSWFIVGDGGEPFVAASQFMLRSLTNSFTTVP